MRHSSWSTKPLDCTHDYYDPRSEFAYSFSVLAVGAIAFLASQACKMVAIALLVPSQGEGRESFETIQEFLKCAIGLIDVLAISYALKYYKAGGTEHNPAKLAASVLGIFPYDG